MLFDSCGPFFLPRERNGHWRKAFWQQVEDYLEGLSSAVGCYAFCIDNGRRVRPWYVGKTVAKGGFRDEVFAPLKLVHYDDILAPRDQDVSFRKGLPCIMLFPLMTDTFYLSENRSSSAAYIEWLETTLIGMALSQNPAIANKSKTRFFRDVYVNGVIGEQYQGRPSRGAAAARKIFTSK